MLTHFPLVCNMHLCDLYIIDGASRDQWSSQNNPPSYFSGKSGVILDLHIFCVFLQVLHIYQVFLSQI